MLTCATGYITVFLVALVTDRAFLLHQPNGTHTRWEDIYEEKHISWRADKHMDYEAEKTHDDFHHFDFWCAIALDPASTTASAAASLVTQTLQPSMRWHQWRPRHVHRP